MNLQLIRKTVGVATLLCASFVFASQALAVPLARVIVAKSGGNYTTITAALAAIAPTAAAPYVIEVWPGVYTEPSAVVMKSYVHLKGSGRDVTTVKTALGTTSNTSVISADGKIGVTISGLTITGGYIGIITKSTFTDPGSVTISDNLISGNSLSGIVAQGWGSTGAVNSVRITGNRVVGNNIGIDITVSSAVITGNTISGNGSTTCGTVGSCTAIILSHASTEIDLGSGLHHIITDNVITGNIGTGIYLCQNTRATISNNIIAGNTFAGIEFAYATAEASVTNNKIVNNGGSLYTDIVFTSLTALNVRPSNISFNVFDDITGDHGVGSYNVNSNGDPILVP